MGPGFAILALNDGYWLCTAAKPKHGRRDRGKELQQESAAAGSFFTRHNVKGIQA
jgi:hypothetical protein